MDSVSTEQFVITTTKKKFFHEYLIIKRPVINIILNKLNRNDLHPKNYILSDKLLQILAELLYLADIYSEMPEEARWKLVFSRKSKMIIVKQLNMKEHYLNNYLSTLRKLQVIKNGKINKLFLISGISRELIYRFVFNGEEHEQQVDEKNNS